MRKIWLSTEHKGEITHEGIRQNDKEKKECQKSRDSETLKRTSVKAAKARERKRRNLVLLFTLRVQKKFIQMKSKLGFILKAFHVGRSLLCSQQRKVQMNFTIPLKEDPV
jgi:hypothetical protein